MTEGQNWNAPGAQAYQQAPAGAAYPQPGMAPAGAYGMQGAPGMMAPQVPPGFYFDQLSGLVLPEGTTLAPVGRRIGASGLGYLIWGLISWGSGQTPVQQVLGMQVWKPQEKVNATWGTMFLRGLAWIFLGIIPFAQIVSFFLFLSGREHRALHDSVASVVVLHDPNKVLKRAV